jgi:hypothetical protein
MGKSRIPRLNTRKHWEYGYRTESEAARWYCIIKSAGLQVWRRGRVIYGPVSEMLEVTRVCCVAGDTMACAALAQHQAGKVNLAWAGGV